MHWAEAARVAKTWKQIVHLLCRPRYLVRITMGRKRLQDPDNAVASVKPILDALVSNGLIIDDRREYLELEVIEEKSKEPYTVIEVLQLTPDWHDDENNQRNSRKLGPNRPSRNQNT